MVMYAPHTLFVRRESVTKDEYNRTQSLEERWERIGGCRCDDSDTSNLVDDAGNAFVPRFHIVSERYGIVAGDIIRVMNGESVRGEGQVRKIVKTNYLNYMSIYV